MGTVALIAADQREFAGVLPYFRDVAEVGGGMDFARTGELGDRRFLLIANGPGPRLAAAAVDWALQRGDVEVVVSTGFCGGLEQDLHVGDIIIALQVYSLEESILYTVEQPIRSPDARSGGLLSTDRVIVSAAEKRRLREYGAIAVEMEAAGVAAAALRRGVRFCCIRAVSDVANEGFAVDLNAARSKDGRFRVAWILAGALRRPATGIPELFRLQKNSRRAAKDLGDFLAECRF